MTERSNKFVGSANVDNSHAFAAVKPALEFVRLDPGERPVQPFDER
jgi:hypothetical protein